MKPDKNNDLSETHPLFPSGDWEGFYTYVFGPGADRHPMAFLLDFQNNQVSGAGGDDVGPFRWRGQYDKEALRCQMTKYYATHTVFYDGQVDENGIWGTWTIGGYFSGGFHIWPKAEAENEAATEALGMLDQIQLDYKAGNSIHWALPTGTTILS